MRRGFSIAAVAILMAACAPATAAQAPPGSEQVRATYQNPVLDGDFPDPALLRAPDGMFYAYATQTSLGGREINIQVARSADLARWEHLGDALPVKPTWASTTQNFWAPHVAYHDGTYYLYYSAQPNPGAMPGLKDGLCLAVATARSPSGPFKDIGSPLTCGEGFVNIDPMSFDDPKTGKRLLYWGSGFEPIRVQELAADRVSFAPGSRPIDLVFPKPGPTYQRLVEGAWVVLHDGWYYMFYSGDNCCGEKAHYAVMVARSKSATGPFETLGQTTGREESTILVRDDEWLAPGHNSVITDTEGRHWMHYHAMRAPKAQGSKTDAPDRRVMLMDRITFRDGWPVVGDGTPSTAPQPVPETR